MSESTDGKPEVPTLEEEVRLLRSVVNSLVRSVEGSGYTVLYNGQAKRFLPERTEAIRRANQDPEAW